MSMALGGAANSWLLQADRSWLQHAIAGIENLVGKLDPAGKIQLAACVVSFADTGESWLQELPFYPQAHPNDFI